MLKLHESRLKRRYADVVVHRLLGAAIGLERLPEPARDRDALRALADNLNTRHRNAQVAPFAGQCRAPPPAISFLLPHLPSLVTSLLSLVVPATFPGEGCMHGTGVCWHGWGLLPTLEGAW